jgi:hypothetical protein
MKEQDIVDFEFAIRKVCEVFREKLTHATLAGTLDTVKTSYHIASIQSFTIPPTNESPSPVKDD